jgi:site-specific recombinase XerD
MAQNISWEWLLAGFRIDLETQVKPKTIKCYCEHVSYFIRWARENNKGDPRLVTKRDIQEFLHFVASTPAVFSLPHGVKRQVQRDENSRWHHYYSLKRFFTWAVGERYLKQNPADTIVLRQPKAAPVEPYKPEHIGAFLKVLDHEWQTATTTRQKMLAARNRAVLLLFLDSFIRLEECSQLKLGDIDLDRQRILVRKSKTGKPRIAGFGPQTKKSLWRY